MLRRLRKWTQCSFLVVFQVCKVEGRVSDPMRL